MVMRLVSHRIPCHAVLFHMGNQPTADLIQHPDAKDRYGLDKSTKKKGPSLPSVLQEDRGVEYVHASGCVTGAVA